MSICDLVEDGTFSEVYTSPNVSAHVDNATRRARINIWNDRVYRSFPLTGPFTQARVDFAITTLATQWKEGALPVKDLAAAGAAILQA